MATVTPNFNWPVPTSTDLVKDGATAIEALGDSIDASLVDLKGGTTGQVLSKTSNTDMDFTWVAQDDSNAIQNSIVDAKGDLIAASAADTPARLAVGSDGETLVADSSTATGLSYQANFAAGKNKIINGDFGIWQRGTSFSTSGAWSFNADRFQGYMSSGTATLTQQTFTAGTAPVAGYEGTYFLRATAPASGGTFHFRQSIENVRTFAGQTVTLSFWAKASATTSLNTYFNQTFGTGGSTTVSTTAQTNTITTSWARYTYTVALPSISGKTIGTGSFIEPYFVTVNNFTSSATIDYWGIQVEAGSVATAFQTATGTIQGELAACRRYFEAQTGLAGGNDQSVGNGFVVTATTVLGTIYFENKRVAPTASLNAGNIEAVVFNNGVLPITNVIFGGYGLNSNKSFSVQGDVTSTTVGYACFIRGGNANYTIWIDAEL